MVRLTDFVALSISIASMVSSVLYTYDSRHVNSARFFNEIHTEYVSHCYRRSSISAVTSQDPVLALGVAGVDRDDGGFRRTRGI